MKHNPGKMIFALIAAFAVIAVGGAYALTRDNSSRDGSSTHGSMAGMHGMDHSSGMAIETNGQPYDQAFIDNMVPHHQAAVEMARIELAKGKRADVQKLAARVVSAQNAEIERMKAWRSKWFDDSSTPAEMPMSMPGMDVNAVRDAKDIDRAFVAMMIPHHESAIAMATDATVKGEHPEIRDLAAMIIADQEREIVQMKAWQESW